MRVKFLLLWKKNQQTNQYVDENTILKTKYKYKNYEKIMQKNWKTYVKLKKKIHIHIYTYIYLNIYENTKRENMSAKARHNKNHVKREFR